MEAGGRCQNCGYDKCLDALQFHHRDPSQKKFDINRYLVSKSLETVREEIKKCDLLCSNCHFEVEYEIDQTRVKDRAAKKVAALVEEQGKLYGNCPRHGRVEFSEVKEGKRLRLRCKRCNVDAWQRWYWRTKDKLIAAAGGKCLDCGYSKCRAALEFHHRVPAEKEFALGKVRKSLAKMLEEIKKCDLLCSNCHSERHAAESVAR